MERGNLLKTFLLDEKDIWTVPHVVQELHRRELRWDEFLKFYIDDLAFGASKQEWVKKLIDEGNIGLGLELMKITNTEKDFNELLAQQTKHWAEMFEYALGVANKSLDEQSDQISENERSQFLDMLELSKRFALEKSYGEAYDTADKAHELLKRFVENRRKALEGIYRQVSGQIQLIGMRMMETPTDLFPGGNEMLERARNLYNAANMALLNRDFAFAQKATLWLEDIIANNNVPVDEIDKVTLVDAPVFIAKPLFEELPKANSQSEALPAKFERDWNDEDDDYLIDNYDVLTNEQLKSRFISTIDEIENRIQYLGLSVDRNKRIKLPLRNPYVAGIPIKSDKVFVGREDVFDFIRDTLGYTEEYEDRNLCALFGHRRTGKTSLLLQLRGKKKDILAPRIPVYVDLEGILPRSSKTYLPIQIFFWKLALTIADELTASGIEIRNPSQNEFEEADWNFREFLKDAVKATGNKGFVILFDEFQAIEPRQGVLNVDIYHMLRHIIQHTTGVGFILSGTMEVERLMREYKAAMFGAAIIKRIDFLDERDARKLIKSPVNSYITYTKEAEDIIVQLTACHPYFVQLVCHTLTSYLIDRGKEKVFAHDVERIIPQVLERGIHFTEIWATDMLDLEKYLMAIVGELLGGRDEWCSLSEIENILSTEKIMPKDETRLIEALEKLGSRRILKMNDDGKSVRFYVTMFGKWVATNKPLAIVRRDIQAEAAKLNRRIERDPLS